MIKSNLYWGILSSLLLSKRSQTIASMAMVCLNRLVTPHTWLTPCPECWTHSTLTLGLVLISLRKKCTLYTKSFVKWQISGLILSITIEFNSIMLTFDPNDCCRVVLFQKCDIIDQHWYPYHLYGKCTRDDQGC